MDGIRKGKPDFAQFHPHLDIWLRKRLHPVQTEFRFNLECILIPFRLLFKLVLITFGSGVLGPVWTESRADLSVHRPSLDWV